MGLCSGFSFKVQLLQSPWDAFLCKYNIQNRSNFKKQLQKKFKNRTVLPKGFFFFSSHVVKFCNTRRGYRKEGWHEDGRSQLCCSHPHHWGQSEMEQQPCCGPLVMDLVAPGSIPATCWQEGRCWREKEPVLSSFCSLTKGKTVKAPRNWISLWRVMSENAAQAGGQAHSL